MSDSYGATFTLSPDGNSLSIDYDGEFTQQLKFGQEVISTEPVSGQKMKTISWRTGRNSFTQTSKLEGGITETVSYVFYDNGAQVRQRGECDSSVCQLSIQVNTKASKPSENLVAELSEWYERIN